jgi:antitoxin component YwqK of YwqJK toxin-antitoxin module
MKPDQSKHDADGKLKDGEFKEYFKDGTLACVGKCCNGEKIGEWKHYLRNGVLRAVGRFAAGKMTGAWKWYRENGKLMQTGSFVEERKSGIWRRYHRNGRCMRKANSPTTKRSANGACMTPRANSSKPPSMNQNRRDP